MEPLRCDECGATAEPPAVGWASVFLDPDPEDDSDGPDLAIFCPACIKHEFGGIVPDSDYKRP
jgi:hypothetical protein